MWNVSLAVASANFPDEHFGGAIVLYLIANIAVSIPHRMAAQTNDTHDTGDVMRNRMPVADL